MKIKDYYFNQSPSDLMCRHSCPRRGMLFRSVYPLYDKKLHHNDIFVISRVNSVSSDKIFVYAYRIKIYTIFDEPEREFNFFNLIYSLSDIPLWEERLNKHLGLHIDSRFEILDIR